MTVVIARTEHTAALRHYAVGSADGFTARRLSPEQEAEVAAWMRTGPDVEVDGVVHWRCTDIQARTARE